MDDAVFVDASVDMQLGSIETCNLVANAESRARAMQGSSGSALMWNTQLGRPYPYNGWVLKDGNAPGEPNALINQNGYVNPRKVPGTLQELLAYGARSDLLIDMQDRRLRNIALADGSLHPVFTFNREIGSVGRILWPLPGYYDLGSNGFLGPPDWTPVRWQNKCNRVAWRGSHGGRADRHGEVRREGLRLKPLLRKFEQGKLTKAQVEDILFYFPRHRIVQRYIDDSRFDLGFTSATQKIALENYEFFRPYIKPRMLQQDALQFKYLLVLRGADVGSSFYWTMNSGSLGLVMEGYFESFASGHFKPWEHYVPFKADLSDLEERLEWCRNNDAECEDITRNARAVCKLLDRADLRAEIGRLIVARMEDRIAECSGALG